MRVINARSLNHSWVAAMLLAAASAGCQSFAPGAFSLASSKEEEIIKLAAVDPFPSPADVGLEQPTATP